MEGRRALVTGGAGGIGQATAAVLAERGARVVTVDLTGGDIDADLREPDAVEAAVGEAAERLGGPADLLVAAAGVYRITPALELEAKAWDDVHAINLRGVFLTCRAVARRLVDAGQPGAIVNLASTAALEGDAAEPSAHYNASKAGVVALTKQLAIELAPQRIRVNCVCPGVIDTPMLRVLDSEAGAAWVKQAVPLSRLGRPEEVARVIAFLASDEASYVTGVALPIDGGLTA
jgi:meso-butanediol dehydrogenase/(S,S)-butanediol dehydrogenase/diacetyl reductase